MTAKEVLQNIEKQKEEARIAFLRNIYLEVPEYREVINALEKQIPKKPYKIREHNKNDYYCTICKRYLGNEMELKHDCLKPEYCQHCGTKIDWLDWSNEK